MKKKLFLLDAMALIYRAHFAFSKNPRVNSKGMNTGAALGFTNTLIDVLEKQKPTHLGVAFDTPEPTFRHQAFEAYKAQREAQPEDITSAIPYIYQIIEAFNIPALVLPGYEADDVIGTIAKAAAKDPDFEVFMMTPDKDYSQLVEERIFLFKPAFMGNDVAIWGVKEVLDKWEINEVSQVVDILGLQGDAVDNIPGVPGVGEKTAKKMIQTYGSVENLLAHAADFKGKQRENLENFKEQALLSKQLATIDIQVPLAFDEEALRLVPFHPEKLRAVFNELEFRTLSKKFFKEDSSPSAQATKTTAKPTKTTPGQMDLFGASPNEPATPSPANELWVSETPNTEEAPAVEYQNYHTTRAQYYCIDTPDLIEQLIASLQTKTSFCFDTETTGLSAIDAALVGMSFAWYPKEAYYVPVPADETQAQQLLAQFKPVFENPAIQKIGQNIKYDLAVIQNYGVKLKGKLYDTMLAHYLLEPDMRHNMDVLSKNYLHYEPIEIEQLIGKKGKDQGNMRDVAIDKIVPYACEDADITFQLSQYFAPYLQQRQVENLLFDIEAPLIPVLATMERQGVRIDSDILAEVSKTLSGEIEILEKTIYGLADSQFNIASPKQLGDILFDKLQLDDKAKKTKTGQYATGEEVLAKLVDKHPIVSAILEYREMVKLKNTYIDALPLLVNPRTGKIHTSYNQAVAATGRLSSTNPNLQNIPIRTDKGREIRKAFVPSSPEFVILSADYSQIELRIMAAFSQDETMMEAFNQGRDIHVATAAKIFKVPLAEVNSDMRRKAKTANFGIIYGISAHGLSQRLNIPRKEAGEIIQAYFDEFPSVKQYMDEVVNQARSQEYVQTFLGRRRYLRNINSRNAVERGYAERNAINAPIQGTAADIIKLAMIKIHDYFEQTQVKSKLILQVHDELVFELHQSEQDTLPPVIKRLMEEALPTFPVKLEVESGTGKNWLEAH